MSARLGNAATAVPATNPSCTAIVSHPACASLSLYCAASSGYSALAVNQSDMPMSSATESRTRVLQARRGT